ncbi:MAG TPA: hypothetical protein PKA00_01910 [Saprospiraceae bacterium]|nr:hypothetical protein [Saprospiraceae bacterium]HMQ81626.1 hypothetical protein [Saprospiraceae bacterium]
MKNRIRTKPSYIAALLFMVPIVGYALYGGILLLTHPYADGGDAQTGVIFFGLATLAFAGFMGFLLMKGFLYVMNFSICFDEQNVEINTYLGERTVFRWEDLQEVNRYDTGELEMVLKTGKAIKFKSRMLDMAQFFRAYSQAKTV